MKFSLSFRSFRVRLIVFLLALLTPVLGGIFYYVNANNTEYTEETINSYLELGADVFDYTREQQATTLQAITSSLTWDFGFRTAFAASDPATLFDAALNVMDRSLDSADMLMITDLDFRVIVDTETQGFDILEDSWLSLLEEADASEEGRSETIVTISEMPFQLIALPMYLPRQVAWIIGGFALDDDFVEQVKETTVSEISILKVENNTTPEMIVSTLPRTQQPLLETQIDFNFSPSNQLQRINYDGEEFTSLVRPLYGTGSDPLQIFAVIQRSYDENNENVVQFQELLVRFYFGILIASLLAVLLLARSITKPVSKLAHAVKKIEQGDYGQTVEINSKDEIGDLADSVNSMAKGLAEKEKVRDLLGKVVSHQIAEELLGNPVELGGEERTATILFSDIQGFTSYCENKSPKEVLGALNEVLSKISDIIEAKQGVVDKFNGDAVMALFGVPIKGQHDTSNAIEAALEIELALKQADGRLNACIGINTGLVVAGNLGSNNRLNYSVIGDTVNLSARLEGLTRLYHVNTIVSESSKNAAPEFAYQELDEVCVAGKSESVRIFELIASQEDVTPERLEEAKKFELALHLYREQKWNEAESLLFELQESGRNSPLCQIFLDRVSQFKETPPTDNWKGVFVFNSK